MGWFGKKKPQELMEDPISASIDAYVDEQVGAMGAYVCTRCGDEHVALELAFQWPDVAIRTGSVTDEEPDDRIVIGGHVYIRGTLRVPIHGSKRDFAVGLWCALDDDGEEGQIANQLALHAPLLGARARVVAGASGRRPMFQLVDHSLARAQREGISAEVAAGWRSAEAHRGQPEPLGKPYRGVLDTHGWELLDAAAKGELPCDAALIPGDFAKVIVRLITVGEDGEPEPFVAGWWIDVDHVDGDRVSGTLRSSVAVPATLSTGTRMWPEPDQILARQRP